MYHVDAIAAARGVPAPWAASVAHRSTEPTRDGPPPRFGLLHGLSPAMRRVYEMIERVSPTEATVLIIGESGSGKELVASAIHQLSLSRGMFVAVNCAAIPASLVEAELFGYEKGAFTGASRTHRGYFERAAGGTLFLDEITEMSLDLQARLLRVLETGKFWRVGGDAEIRTEVRVIAATNRPLTAAVADGQLREDLLYRLAVFPIELPPLRSRGDDAELLARYFLALLNDESGTTKTLSKRSLDLLRSHAWPGNVRELKNCVQRAFILSDWEIELERMLPAGDAPACEAVADQYGRLSFAVGVPLAEIERKTIFATLAHCQGNKRRAAEMLGISLKTLYNRLNEYAAGLPAPERPLVALE